MLKTLTGLLLGHQMSSEYIPVSSENFIDDIQIKLRVPSGVSVDVTFNHLFLGYKPLLFALIFHVSDKDLNAVRANKKIKLHFSHKHLGSSLGVFEGDEVYNTLLKDYEVIIYKGVHARLNALPLIFQWTNKAHQLMRKNSSNNVLMQGNLYEQVSLMYIVPRTISIVTVGDGKNFNMFPTDLHGKVGNHSYTDSLRLAGKACKQVDQFKKVVISDLSPDFQQDAYAMGKNHMKELIPIENFKTHSLSEKFRLPLPAGVIRYRELIKETDFDYGIHRIHFFNKINEVQVTPVNNTLSTIHRFYAQWRINHNLPVR